MSPNDFFGRLGTNLLTSIILWIILDCNLGLGGSDFSTPASKLNYLSYATVTPTSGSLSSTSFLFVTIYSADKTTQLASSVKLTELNKQVRVYYNTTTPSYGTQVRLKGNAGYYGVTVAGGWTP